MICNKLYFFLTLAGHELYFHDVNSGVRVMAKWTDGFYYPGCALEMEKDDRYY